MLPSGLAFVECPSCRSPKALLSHETATAFVYFCANCQHVWDRPERVQSKRHMESGRPMPTKKKRSIKVAPVMAKVIRPVATRLNRIEDLLIEMRGVLDVHLKRIAALQRQVDLLAEKDRITLPD
jgi:hypothetical protein